MVCKHNFFKKMTVLGVNFMVFGYCEASTAPVIAPAAVPASPAPVIATPAPADSAVAPVIAPAATPTSPAPVIATPAPADSAVAPVIVPAATPTSPAPVIATPAPADSAAVVASSDISASKDAPKKRHCPSQESVRLTFDVEVDPNQS